LIVMAYRITRKGKAEDFRGRISELMEKDERDFERPFNDREKDFEEVVDDFVLGKNMIAVEKDGKIVGFLLFTRGGEREAIEKYCPCIYVNLALVDRGFRNQGLAHRMYRKLLEEVLPESEYEYAGVRTQETNPASRESIKDADFEEKARDREEGENLIYYVYEA
jgi:L-amino acid N-acyltransferase YncA